MTNGMENYRIEYVLECKFWTGWEEMGWFKSFNKARNKSKYYEGHQRLYIWENLYDGNELIDGRVVFASG